MTNSLETSLTAGLFDIPAPKKEGVVLVDHITKDYGHGRGDFNISFTLKSGESLGIIGENGAGKTTLIRQLMGFIKPDQGQITLFGMDAYQDAAEIKQYVGYVPGEINYPDVKSGSEFLHEQAKSLGIKDFSFADSVIKRLQLDIRAYPKRMSKGMKQKMAIVAALMIQAPLIILDEPTTGLDPLMRDEFLQLVNEERQRGASVIMSSNTIEELERVCDRVMMISKGRLIDIADVHAIESRTLRDYKIEFETAEDYQAFIQGRKDVLRVQSKYHQVTLRLEQSEINALFQNLEHYQVKYLTQVPYTLKTYFDERSL